MEVESRHRSALPPIELDMEKIKRYEAAHQARNSEVSSRSQSAAVMNQSPSSPYKRHTSLSRDSSNSASAPSISTILSNPDSRVSRYDKELPPRRSPPPSTSLPPLSNSLSLPSIKEALGATPSLSQHAPPSSAPQSSYTNPAPRSPEVGRPRSRSPPQEYRGAGHNYSSHTQNSARMTPSSQYSYPYPPRSPSAGSYTSRLPEQQPPQQSQAQSHYYSQSWGSNHHSQTSGQAKPSYSRPPPPPPPPPPAENGPPEPPAQRYSSSPNGVITGRHTSSWRTTQNEMHPPEDGKHSQKFTYGESVKRHLDVFDLESSLNEISDSSKQLVDFSSHYSHRAHQTQRSGPLPGSTPHLNEIDDMIKQASRVRDSLDRLKSVVISQQEALAKRSKESSSKPANSVGADSDDSFHETGKGGFAGPDPKKRRGRAAPPGRCHSCNRAETPEWRRGPDGARTLCNACGLHYAKLTRKMGAGKASAMSSSNLRPKSIAPNSP